MIIGRISNMHLACVPKEWSDEKIIENFRAEIEKPGENRKFEIKNKVACPMSGMVHVDILG
jgi:hypothetical protein